MQQDTSAPAKPMPASTIVPQKGYLQAHRDLDRPQPRLGGPLRVHIEQDGGTVHVALPAKRELDPEIFGTPDDPRANLGVPIVTAVPLAMRETEGDEYGTVRQKTPFGDTVLELSGASLKLDLVDATATDAARSDDTVHMTASWQDDQGNTYSVECNEATPAGDAHPVFGGVVTNHLMHGFTGIGTPLMPTEFAYAAFWGKGTVRKNGKVLGEPRMVHGMLTEGVRNDDYDLVFDDQVEPTARMFHVMVAPIEMTDDGPKKVPVQTGFMLPDGKELPFWHVMFDDVRTAPGQ